MTEKKQTKAKEQRNNSEMDFIDERGENKARSLDNEASHPKGEKLGSTKNNKKYVYVKLNAKNPAIDVATKMEII